MIKWEYHIEFFDIEFFDRIEEAVYIPSESTFNKLGQDRWELVTVADGRAYFKRQIVENYITEEEIKTAKIPAGYYD